MALATRTPRRPRPALGRRAAIAVAPFFVAGAGLYMTWPSEPDRWMAAAGLFAATTFAAAAWRRTAVRWPALWLLALAFGFVWAMVRADLAATPRLDREGAGMLYGVAAWIEADPARPRLTLAEARFERWGRTETLDRARVRLASGERPQVGDRVRVRAVLRPPPPPVAPGGYDFQRRAYFDGLGAVGFAIGPAEIVSAGDGSPFARTRARFRDVVYAALPDRPDVAGVIAALTVGDRAGVTEADDAALRASGLAHLLAISGLHLGMVAGAVYLIVRLLLAAPHGLALRLPAHKWAAAVAILAAAVYLGLSGAAPPAQRAFIMAVAAMVAIMTDRLRSSLWFVAWAAVVVTLWAPHVVAGPSFQLSFAAATGIVAAYETLSDRRRHAETAPFQAAGALRPIVMYVVGVAGASLLATAATAPLALAHFQQAPAYGVVANLAAMPLMAFLVMPAAVMAGCLAPLGLADPALWAMAFGIELVLDVAHWTAALPGGVIRVAATPGWVVAAFLAGGAWIAILRGPFRLAGLVGVAAAVIGLATARPPDILVSGEGRLAAVVHDDALYVTSRRRGRFEQDVWRQMTGTAEVRALADVAEGDAAEWARCDDRGCAVRLHGRTVAFAIGPGGLAADCRAADVVIVLTGADARPAMGCGSGVRVLDGGDFAIVGAHAIWLGETGAAVETVRQVQGPRLWSGWRGQ